MAYKRTPKTPLEKELAKADQERKRKANLLLNNATERVTYLNFNLRSALGEVNTLKDVLQKLKPLQGKGLKKLDVPEELVDLLIQLEQLASQHLPQMLDAAEAHIFPERQPKPRTAKLASGREDFVQAGYGGDLTTLKVETIVDVPHVTRIPYPTAPVPAPRALAA